MSWPTSVTPGHLGPLSHLLLWPPLKADPATWQIFSSSYPDLLLYNARSTGCHLQHDLLSLRPWFDSNFAARKIFSSSLPANPHCTLSANCQCVPSPCLVRKPKACGATLLTLSPSNYTSILAFPSSSPCYHQSYP